MKPLEEIIDANIRAQLNDPRWLKVHAEVGPEGRLQQRPNRTQRRAARGR